MAIKYSGVNLGQIEALLNLIGGEAAIPRILSGELVVVKREPPVLDTIIRVDRSIRPVYPAFVKKVMHPELEVTGPAQYSLTQVGLWLYPDQRNGVVGNIIYMSLKCDNALADHLGLVDLRAIQAKGFVVFRKLFGVKTIFGWRSVVRGHSVKGRLFVPCLYGTGERVLLHWVRLENRWDDNSPAGRFGK